MSSIQSQIILWDSSEKVSIRVPKNKTILFWNQFTSDHNYFSIPDLIDKDSDYLRAKYLEWIYKLGKTKVDSKNIIEVFKLRKNFSAWWMSLVVEKSNFAKSTYIDEIIRLILLDKLIKKNSVSKIIIYSSNQKLIDVLKKYSKRKKIIFKSIKLKSLKSKSSKNFFKNLFYFLPHSLRALIWLIYKSFYSLPLRKVGIEEWNRNNKGNIFVSYLFNMKGSDCKKFLNSTYWGYLPEKLFNASKRTSWIHLFVKDKFIKNPSEAANLINRLNKNNKLQTHVTLFSFINLRVIKKVFFDWIKLHIAFRKINFDKNFPLLDDFDLKDYYRSDFLDSFVGQTSIDNLLMMNLFNEALNKLDEKNTLTYLLENQGWEIAMLGVCKSLNLNKVIGFSHASTRYWDLRLFYDKKEYFDFSSLKLPIPDYLAVNSINAYETYIKMGYPQKNIKNVESLRHLYLNGLLNNKKKIIKKDFYTILILGDYLEKNTYYQLELLNLLPDKLIKKINFIFKPHPACNIDLEIFKNLDIEKANQTIFELLPKADSAYCSSFTSACIDAYASGIPVIIPLDPQILNMSPLKDYKDVNFIRNCRDLEKVIIKLSSKNNFSVSQRGIFNLSTELLSWQRLLYENDFL
jgi:surface carbohydrate biosynthesis protein (TIGR04326 family)